MERLTVRVTSTLRERWARQSLVMAALAAFVFLFSAIDAHAISTPETGSFLYDAYDIIVNNLLKGALGFVVAIFVFITGIAMFFRQMIIPGVICVACTALIIKSDSIISSLGMII